MNEYRYEDTTAFLDINKSQRCEPKSLSPSAVIEGTD